MKQYCNLCGCEQEFKVYEDNSHAELWGNSHAELRGNSHAELWGNSHAVLCDNSHAVLCDNSHAVLCDNSHAGLCDNSHAVLWGNSHAVLWGNSHAELCGNSHAVLRGNSHAELCGNSHAVLRDNSHAELRGNSHAELCDNSHAVLRGNSHAELCDNSHAQCKSPYACGILKSITTQCTGRHIGDKPLSPKEYLTFCGIEIKNQYVILYKSTLPNGSSHHADGIKYIIGKETVAPDWDADFKGECGQGLHLSPSIQQAIYFNDLGCYFACRVHIKDIANLPAYASMPDKIRVRACTPLYEVDREGNKK